MPRLEELIAGGQRRYAGLDEGRLTDYIPLLEHADLGWFGLSLVGVDGTEHAAGDTEVPSPRPR